MIEVTATIGIQYEGYPITDEHSGGFSKVIRQSATEVQTGIDMATTYVMGGEQKPYIKHYVKLFLYDNNIYLDYEDFFERLVVKMREHSDLKFWLLDQYEIELPENETRICPSCEGKGEVKMLDYPTNKLETAKCTACDGEGRVDKTQADKIQSWVEPKIYCQYCLAARKYVEVPAGTKKCGTCEIKTKTTEIRNESWTTTKTSIRKMTGNQIAEHLNQHIKNLANLETLRNEQYQKSLSTSSENLKKLLTKSQ